MRPRLSSGDRLVSALVLVLLEHCLFT
jgi:hypothetical protein